MKSLGACIRLSPSYISLFSRLHLLFYRSTSYGTGPTLTSALLARFRLRTYPSYQVKRSFAIFDSRKQLLEYEEALKLERKMEECLGEVDGFAKKGAEREQAWKIGEALFERVWPKWLKIVDEEKSSGHMEGNDEDRLTYYRKRFHPGWLFSPACNGIHDERSESNVLNTGWPLTRVVYKGAAILARQHKYEREAEILTGLLHQTSFRRGKRGAWYDRLALVLMHHFDDKDVSRRRALELCRTGLQDPWTHLSEPIDLI
jgi:fanconi-associated nuclease 1